MNFKSLSKISMVLLSGALLTASAAYAFPGMRGDPEARLKEMDSNADGQVSRAEAEAAARARFDGADANKDGKLSEEEIRAAREAKHQDRAEARFQKADQDDDGMISSDEAVGQAMDHFDAVDTDKDGVISQEEREAMRKTMKDKWREKRDNR